MTAALRRSLTRADTGPITLGVVDGEVEPPVGFEGVVGSPRDQIRFVHVDDAPDGWMRYDHPLRGYRVPWSAVRFWAPLRRVVG